MLRKLLLTGGLVVASDQGSAQILMAQVICVLYLIVVVRTMPYESDKDDVLQVCASTSLLLTLMAAFTLKAQERVDKARTEGGSTMRLSVAEDTDRGIVGTMLVTINAMVLAFAAMNLVILVWPFLKTCKGRMKRHREQRRENRELQKKLRNKLEAKQRKDGKHPTGKNTKKANQTKKKPIVKGKGKEKGRRPSKSDKKAVKGWGGDPPKKRNSTKVAPNTQTSRAPRSPSARRASASASKSPSMRRASASGPQRRKSGAQQNRPGRSTSRAK
jgi:hypothetical protein